MQSENGIVVLYPNHTVTQTPVATGILKLLLLTTTPIPRPRPSRAVMMAQSRELGSRLPYLVLVSGCDDTSTRRGGATSHPHKSPPPSQSPINSRGTTRPLLRRSFTSSWHFDILANKSWTPLLTLAPQIDFEHRGICSTQRPCSPRPGLCPASGLQPILSAS